MDVNDSGYQTSSDDSAVSDYTKFNSSQLQKHSGELHKLDNVSEMMEMKEIPASGPQTPVYSEDMAQSSFSRAKRPAPPPPPVSLNKVVRSQPGVRDNDRPDTTPPTRPVPPGPPRRPPAPPRYPQEKKSKQTVKEAKPSLSEKERDPSPLRTSSKKKVPPRPVPPSRRRRSKVLLDADAESTTNVDTDLDASTETVVVQPCKVSRPRRPPPPAPEPPLSRLRKSSAMQFIKAPLTHLTDNKVIRKTSAAFFDRMPVLAKSPRKGRRCSDFTGSDTDDIAKDKPSPPPKPSVPPTSKLARANNAALKPCYRNENLERRISNVSTVPRYLEDRRFSNSSVSTKESRDEFLEDNYAEEMKHFSSLSSLGINADASSVHSLPNSAASGGNWLGSNELTPFVSEGTSMLESGRPRSQSMGDPYKTDVCVGFQGKQWRSHSTCDLSSAGKLFVSNVWDYDREREKLSASMEAVNVETSHSMNNLYDPDYHDNHSDDLGVHSSDFEDTDDTQKDDAQYFHRSSVGKGSYNFDTNPDIHINACSTEESPTTEVKHSTYTDDDLVVSSETTMVHHTIEIHIQRPSTSSAPSVEELLRENSCEEMVESYKSSDDMKAYSIAHDQDLGSNESVRSRRTSARSQSTDPVKLDNEDDSPEILNNIQSVPKMESSSLPADGGNLRKNKSGLELTLDVRRLSGYSSYTDGSSVLEEESCRNSPVSEFGTNSRKPSAYAKYEAESARKVSTTRKTSHVYAVDEEGKKLSTVYHISSDSSLLTRNASSSHEPAFEANCDRGLGPATVSQEQSLHYVSGCYVEHLPDLHTESLEAKSQEYKEAKEEQCTNDVLNKGNVNDTANDYVSPYDYEEKGPSRIHREHPRELPGPNEHTRHDVKHTEHTVSHTSIQQGYVGQGRHSGGMTVLEQQLEKGRTAAWVDRLPHIDIDQVQLPHNTHQQQQPGPQDSNAMESLRPHHDAKRMSTASWLEPTDDETTRRLSWLANDEMLSVTMQGDQLIVEKHHHGDTSNAGQCPEPVSLANNSWETKCQIDTNKQSLKDQIRERSRQLKREVYDPPVLTPSYQRADGDPQYYLIEDITHDLEAGDISHVTELGKPVEKPHVIKNTP